MIARKTILHLRVRLWLFACFGCACAMIFGLAALPNAPGAWCNVLFDRIVATGAAVAIAGSFVSRRRLLCAKGWVPRTESDARTAVLQARTRRLAALWALSVLGAVGGSLTAACSGITGIPIVAAAAASVLATPPKIMTDADAA